MIKIILYLKIKWNYVINIIKYLRYILIIDYY